MVGFVNVIRGVGSRRFSVQPDGIQPQRRKRSLVPTMAVKDLSDQEFKASVLESSKPVLVDFYATWCGPCKLLSPIVEWAEYEYADDIDVFKVNVDEQPEYVKQFNVNALPHLVLFQNGEDVSHITGLIKKAELSKHIQQYI